MPQTTHAASAPCDAQWAWSLRCQGNALVVASVGVAGTDLFFAGRCSGHSAFHPQPFHMWPTFSAKRSWNVSIVVDLSRMFFFSYLEKCACQMRQV